MRKCVIALVAVIGISACNRPVSIVTPEGKRAWVALQTVERLGELQQAAITANALTIDRKPALPTDVTRVIVGYCVSAVRVAQQMPGGWAKTVIQGWAEAKTKIPPQYLSSPYIQAAVTLFEAILADLASKPVARNGVIVMQWEGGVA